MANVIWIGTEETEEEIPVCETDAVYIPESTCDDCEALSLRIRALENRLAALTEISFSKTDKNSTISGVFLGRID